MEREQVIDIVLNASSWEQCQQAKRILCDWMKQNPDDWGMLDVGEALEMTMDGLEPPIAFTDKIKQEVAA